MNTSSGYTEVLSTPTKYTEAFSKGQKVSTWQADKNGQTIYAGDYVKDSDGFIGVVKFVNCAWRYDIANGEYLKHNSSLLFKDCIGTLGLCVIKITETKKGDV